MSVLQILVYAAWAVLAVCVYLMGAAFLGRKRRTPEIELKDG
jgi:hypothetical protein